MAFANEIMQLKKCVEKILEDDPTIELDVALAWTVNAKNAIFSHKGFSPYQLVLGQNPNLPSVMTRSHSST